MSKSNAGSPATAKEQPSPGAAKMRSRSTIKQSWRADKDDFGQQALIEAFRNEFGAAARDREVLIQHVLTLTTRLAEQEGGAAARYAELSARHEALAQDRSRLASAIIGLEAQVSESNLAREQAQIGLGAMEGERNRLEGELVKRLADLESQLALKASEDAAAATSAIADRDREIARLHASLESVEAAKTAGELANTVLRERLTDAERARKETDEELKGLHSAVSSLHDTLSRHEADASALSLANSDLEASLRNAQARIDAAEVEKQEREAAHVQLARQSAAQLAELDASTKEAIGSVESRLARALEESAHAAQSYDRKINELTGKIALLEMDNKEHLSAAAHLATTLRDLEGELSSRDELVAELEARAADAEATNLAQGRALEDAQALWTAQSAEMRRYLQTAVRDLEEANLALAGKNADAEAAMLKIRRLEIAFEALAIEKADIESALQTRLRDLQDANTTIATKNADTDAATLKISGLEIAFEALAVEKADIEFALQTRLRDLQDANTTIATKNADAEAAALKIRRLEIAFEELAVEKADIEFALQTRLRDLQDANTKIATKNADAEAAALKIRRLEIALEELAAQKADIESTLQTSLRELNDAYATLSAANAASAVSLQAHVQMIEELTLTLAQRTVVAEAAETKIRELECAYAALAGDKTEMELALHAQLQSLWQANENLAASNREIQSQLHSAAAFLGQQQEEMTALAADMVVLKANERDAARQLATSAEEMGKISERLEQREIDCKELEAALAAAIEREVAARSAQTERDLQISAEFRERIQDAEDALRVLGYVSSEGGGADGATVNEVDQLRTTLARIREVAGEAARGRDLVSSIKDRERELDAVISRARDDIARHAGMVEALETDLRAVAAELASREESLGSTSQSWDGPSDVGILADLLRQQLEHLTPGEGAVEGLEGGRQKLVALAAVLTRRVGPSLGRDPATSPGTSDGLILVDPWRQTAEEELARLRADRARLDDELDRLQAASQALTERVARSVYWRMRSAAAQLVARNVTRTKPQSLVERSTWPED